MTTTRELCCTLSATLHTPDVDRWAEHLEARELLPGLDRQVCDFDTAVLMPAGFKPATARSGLSGR